MAELITAEPAAKRPRAEDDDPLSCWRRGPDDQDADGQMSTVTTDAHRVHGRAGNSINDERLAYVPQMSMHQRCLAARVARRYVQAACRCTSVID